MSNHASSCEEIPLDTILPSRHNLSLKAFDGEAGRHYQQEIARLRIDMFKEFPYLYEGSLEDEKEYLNTYFNSKKSAVLLVFDQDKVVGFSNSIPLIEEAEEITKPFVEHLLKLENYLYIGEVMLETPYQGQGLLRKMYDYHQKVAVAKGYDEVVFMTVKRPLSHPCRPPNYRTLEPIFRHYGCQLLKDLEINISWKQIDTHQIEHNKMQVWSKKVSSTQQ